MGNVLNAGFDQVFNMYNQLVIETGDIIDTYVYLSLIHISVRAKRRADRAVKTAAGDRDG